MSQEDLFSGARARLEIDGVTFAYVTGLNGREENIIEDAEVCDNPEVAEQVTVGYRASGGCSHFYFLRDTVKSLGWFPKVGANPLEHLRNLIRTKEFTIHVEDNITELPFMIGERAKIATRDWSIAPRTLSVENIEFKLIRWRDVSEASGDNP